MDYVNEFYCIYTIIITHMSLNYIDWYFGSIEVLVLHGHIVSTFWLFFSYNINKLSHKFVKIYRDVGVWVINSNFA